MKFENKCNLIKKADYRKSSVFFGLYIFFFTSQIFAEDQTPKIPNFHSESLRNISLQEFGKYRSRGNKPQKQSEQKPLEEDESQFVYFHADPSKATSVNASENAEPETLRIWIVKTSDTINSIPRLPIERIEVCSPSSITSESHREKSSYKRRKSHSMIDDSFVSMNNRLSAIWTRLDQKKKELELELDNETKNMNFFSTLNKYKLRNEIAHLKQRKIAVDNLIQKNSEFLESNNHKDLSKIDINKMHDLYVSDLQLYVQARKTIFNDKTFSTPNELDKGVVDNFYMKILSNKIKPVLDMTKEMETVPAQTKKEKYKKYKKTVNLLKEFLHSLSKLDPSFITAFKEPLKKEAAELQTKVKNSYSLDKLEEENKSLVKKIERNDRSLKSATHSPEHSKTPDSAKTKDNKEETKKLEKHESEVVKKLEALIKQDKNLQIALQTQIAALKRIKTIQETLDLIKKIE